jgi:hypothetical protein
MNRAIPRPWSSIVVTLAAVLEGIALVLDKLDRMGRIVGDLLVLANTSGRTFSR